MLCDAPKYDPTKIKMFLPYFLLRFLPMLEETVEDMNINNTNKNKDKSLFKYKSTSLEQNRQKQFDDEIVNLTSIRHFHCQSSIDAVL